MICLGKLRLDNELYSSDEEIMSEPKMNGLLNHSLRPDGSIDLNNSVTARDRRRKHNDSVSIIVIILCFRTDRFGQIAKIQIRLLLEEEQTD